MTQQATLDALDRQLKALELRKAGVSYEDIAKALGWAHKNGAWYAVKHAIALVKREPAQALITLEAERLDKMQQALWAKAIKGDYGAVDRIIKLMERRARLLGLDAPESVELSGADGAPLVIAIGGLDPHKDI